MTLNLRLTDSDILGGAPAYIDTVSRYASRGVLVDHNGQVAMMYMAELDLYKLPGGGIEEGESPEEAFLRETIEETGYEAKVVHELGVVEEHKNRNRFLQYSYCYLAKAQRSTEQTSLTEAEEQLGMSVQWMTIRQAIEVMEKDTNSSADDYGNLFMLMRDRMILKEAAGLLEKIDLF
ncbi:NUDIX hydrolase [Paenibacillus sp. YAF4_2]|uniref:NUDIX hydrolase n=1 Tax=Paenibacillus sp. YAF4_2 TaxID=3233085 RepID=UPI003F954200